MSHSAISLFFFSLKILGNKIVCSFQCKNGKWANWVRLHKINLFSTNSKGKGHPLQPPTAWKQNLSLAAGKHLPPMPPPIPSKIRIISSQLTSHINRGISMGLVLPYAVFPCLCTPRTELSQRGSGGGIWSLVNKSRCCFCSSAVKKNHLIGEFGIPQDPCLVQVAPHLERSHARLPAGLPGHHGHISLCAPGY